MKRKQQQPAPDPVQLVKDARDSVWVIESTIAELDSGKPANSNRKDDIDRNVGHLKIVVAKQDVIDSNEDISDLVAAIEAGEAKLAEDIWPADEDE